ncbi:riboflavine-aldehyde-forming enzyme [Pholiota molesta]|nr:riboflavine-aldehyde-forming enzyme [Pholiota molesta]
MHFRKIALSAALIYTGMAYATSGDATFFEPGLGACGVSNNANDFIVALSPAEYSSGANCGRDIEVQYQGKSVIVEVVDLCPGCASGSIDLSPAAFSQLADESLGRIQVTWSFV